MQREVSTQMRSGLYRWLSLGFLAMLAMPLIAACGGEDGNEDAALDTAGSSASDVGSQVAEVDLAPEIGTIDNWYNGEATSLVDLRGNPVLLVFWADY